MKYALLAVLSVASSSTGSSKEDIILPAEIGSSCPILNGIANQSHCEQIRATLCNSISTLVSSLLLRNS